MSIPTKILIQKPDYRYNGKYQFVTGYSGGFGAEMCSHLTREEIIERCTELNGPGQLEDDGENLFWHSDSLKETFIGSEI